MMQGFGMKQLRLLSWFSSLRLLAWRFLFEECWAKIMHSLRLKIFMFDYVLGHLSCKCHCFKHGNVCGCVCVWVSYICELKKGEVHHIVKPKISVCGRFRFKVMFSLRDMDFFFILKVVKMFWSGPTTLMTWLW